MTSPSDSDEAELFTELGELLRAYREANNLTHADLAYELLAEVPTIRNIERGNGALHRSLIPALVSAYVDPDESVAGRR